MIQKLRKKLGPVALGIQLMEESAELSQATSKYIRNIGWLNNPTPVTAIEAKEAMYEEFQDILCVTRLLFPDDDWERLINIDNYPKFERWLKRIEAAEEFKAETETEE